MADTARTRAALETLLADNATGAISAQDLRDMLASVAISSDPKDVKVYRAYMTQTGTDDPVVDTLYENTLGGDIVWSRLKIGAVIAYTGSLVGAFTENKTFGNIYPLSQILAVSSARQSDDAFGVGGLDINGDYADIPFFNIEIIVYP